MRARWVRFVACGLATAFLASLAIPATAHAAFNRNRIINDVVFDNTYTMDANAINAFLNSFPNSCISPNSGFKSIKPVGYSPSGGYRFDGFVTAGEVIYEAAQAYGLNPQVLLVTLQKEQSLVTGAGNNYCNSGDGKYAAALGFGCLDSGGSHSYNNVNLYQRHGVTRTSISNTCVNSATKAGFSQQIIRAAWLLKFGQNRSRGNIDWAVVKGGWDNSDDPQSCYSGPMAQGTFQRCPSGGASYYDGYHTIDGVAVRMETGGTAALYWYTPHFHGNENFFDIFTNWFGSPLVSNTRYAASIEKHDWFVDAAYSQRFSDNISLKPGETAYLRVEYRNFGWQTWDKSVRLGTARPLDRNSVFANATWKTANRIEMKQASVLPGESATYEFSVTAPATVGSYYEDFGLVADGAGWIGGTSVRFQIDVLNQRTASNSDFTRLNSGQSVALNRHLLSPDTHSLLKFQTDGNIVLYANYKPLWASQTKSGTPKSLTMQADGNLVAYNQANQAIWATGTDGNPGAYLLMQTDGNVVLYSASNQPLWATGTVSRPGQLMRVNKTLGNGTMYHSQKLETASGSYRLVFQGDGNVVLIANTGKAVWATGTDGKNMAFLSMQADGNLVAYNTSGKPIWATHTDGNPGAYLFLQEDGNLVMYNQNSRPIWSTGTMGKK